jgi:hypothetical protein
MPIGSFSRKCRSFVPAAANHRENSVGDVLAGSKGLMHIRSHGERLHIFRVEAGSERDLTRY